jgi:hypothetical protein
LSKTTVEERYPPNRHDLSYEDILLSLNIPPETPAPQPFYPETPSSLRFFAPPPNSVTGTPHPTPVMTGTPHPTPVIETPWCVPKYDPNKILSKGDMIIINKSASQSSSRVTINKFTVSRFTKQKKFPIVLNNSRKVSRNTFIMKLFPGAEEYIKKYQSVDWKHLSTFILNKKGDYDKYLK